MEAWSYILLPLWWYFVAFFCLLEYLICKYSEYLLQCNLLFSLISLLKENEETYHYKNKNRFNVAYGSVKSGGFTYKAS